MPGCAVCSRRPILASLGWRRLCPQPNSLATRSRKRTCDQNLAFERLLASGTETETVLSGEDSGHQTSGYERVVPEPVYLHLQGHPEGVWNISSHLECSILLGRTKERPALLGARQVPGALPIVTVPQSPERNMVTTPTLQVRNFRHTEVRGSARPRQLLNGRRDLGPR